MADAAEEPAAEPAPEEPAAEAEAEPEPEAEPEAAAEEGGDAADAQGRSYCYPQGIIAGQRQLSRVAQGARHTRPASAVLRSSVRTPPAPPLPRVAVSICGGSHWVFSLARW